VPVMYATSGFLDVFIETWHAIFGLPDGGREKKPHFDYEMDATKNGALAYRLDGNDVGLCDVPIVYTREILREERHGWALAWTVGVELPTGSESRGFGNGGLDFGGGLLAETSVERWTFTAGVQHAWVARTNRFENAGLDALDPWSFAGGVECRWNDRTSLLAGLRSVSPVTDDFELEEIDGDSIELDLGVAHDLGEHARLTIGITEDLLSEWTPDFTVFAGLDVSL
jgi:hypothetical protein